MQAKQAYRPVLTQRWESGQSGHPVHMEQFLEWLREEEAYFEGEERNSLLLISRLRKIYYNQAGWDSQVIRGAARVQGRYPWVLRAHHLLQVFGEAPPAAPAPGSATWELYTPVYASTDRLFPQRAGLVPPLYAHNRQVLLLPEGYLCDMGHVLAGLDALAHPAPVTPLPSWLMWAHGWLPHCSSNADFATWLGDLCSAPGEGVLHLLRGDTTTFDPNGFSSPADMLGNVDAYAMAQSFNTTTRHGMRFSEMVENYYYTNNPERLHRFATFARCVGLNNWNGKAFDNELQWVAYYTRELRHAMAFYLFGKTGGLAGAKLALKTVRKQFDTEAQLPLLLESFLKALKWEIMKESKAKKRH